MSYKLQACHIKIRRFSMIVKIDFMSRDKLVDIQSLGDKKHENYLEQVDNKNYLLLFIVIKILFIKAFM